MENKYILDLMVSQHALIEALFFVFKNDIKGGAEKAKASFANFTEELKKHFSMEEEAIFNFSTWKKVEIAETIKHLEKEHKEMANIVDKMAQGLEKVSEKEIENLYGILLNHRKKEEEVLYPEIDKELDERERSIIIARINERS